MPLMQLRSLRCSDPSACELLAPVVVVALRAGEIELPLAAREHVAAGVEERLRALVVRDLDRHPARLQPHIGREREQLLAFERERRRPLPVRAAEVDSAFEIDRPSAPDIEGGIARRHALHARLGVAVAIAARFAGVAVLAAPQRLAVEHPQRAGIAGVVVLHGAGVAAHELIAGFALGERDLAGDRGRAEKGAGDDDRCRLHSTVMAAEAVASKPLSPVQAKLSVPLSVATVEKVKNGLAEIAG